MSAYSRAVKRGDYVKALALLDAREARTRRPTPAAVPILSAVLFMLGGAVWAWVGLQLILF